MATCRPTGGPAPLRPSHGASPVSSDRPGGSVRSGQPRAGFADDCSVTSNEPAGVVEPDSGAQSGAFPRSALSPRLGAELAHLDPVGGRAAVVLLDVDL